MSTKSHILTFNNKQIVANNSSSTGQYHNLDLNQKCFNTDSLTSNNPTSKISKEQKQHHFGNEAKKIDDHLFWKKSINPNLITAAPENWHKKDLKNERGVAISNNSTLSLHIAAYENSVEASSQSSDDRGMKENFKKIERMNHFFEFPRSQKAGKDGTPEVQQFKASQKLLNPNAAKTNVQKEKAAKKKPEMDKNFKIEYQNDFFKLTTNRKLWCPKPNPDAAAMQIIAEKSKEVEALMKRGKYLSSGGFGSISICTMKGLKKEFVLKTIKLNGINDIEGIDAELNVYSKMDSPLFPKLLFAGVSKSGCYQLICEYVNGGTLDDLIDNMNATLSIKDVKFIGYELALALECLHAHNICHGDLKENNVALTSNGHVKLLDFGLSKDVTTPIVLPHTLYEAPEVKYEKAAGTPADVWALAQILSNLQQKKVKIGTSNDPNAVDFYNRCQKLKPEERLTKPSDHPFLKMKKSSKPSFKPGKFSLHGHQQPNEEIANARSTFGLELDTMKKIYGLGLLRFPTFATYKSMK